MSGAHLSLSCAEIAHLRSPVSPHFQHDTDLALNLPQGRTRVVALSTADGTALDSPSRIPTLSPAWPLRQAKLQLRCGQIRN